ncbi:MAG: hypothetical protein IK093_02175, partial [Ruminiclostridium sp.]|nr:hypothetical protein [Ruminiclostridium sp.]
DRIFGLHREESLLKRLDIFEFAEQHKDCPTRTREYEIGGKKYIVHSHFVGTKDAHKVLFDNALNAALSKTFGNDGAGLYDIKLVDKNGTTEEKITA